MKIGIFDSGLGGLLTLKDLFTSFPDYDYVYFGDTENMPYGDKASEAVYELTLRGVRYLFSKGCRLVILACNTASSEALRRIQQEYLPAAYPDRRVLGVIRPIAEEAARNGKSIGVIATRGTVDSGAYRKEIKKLAKKAEVFQLAAPELVPLIETGRLNDAANHLTRYLKFFPPGMDTLVLGCTHYPLIKGCLARTPIRVVDQTIALIPSFSNYLTRHPEMERELNKTASIEIRVSKRSDHFDRIAREWFGKDILVKQADFQYN